MSEGLKLKSTVTSKGQLTVPQLIRDRLGLEMGTVVEFELIDGAVIMRKAGRRGRTGSHPIDKAFATLQLGQAAEDLLKEVRGSK